MKVLCRWFRHPKGRKRAVGVDVGIDYGPTAVVVLTYCWCREIMYLEVDGI